MDETLDTAVLDKIAPRVRKDLNEAGFTDEQIAHMDAKDCLDKFLEWNGIMGYTQTIIDAVCAIDLATQGSLVVYED